MKKLAQQIVPEEILKLLPSKDEWENDLTENDAKTLKEEVTKGNASKFIDRFREDFEKIIEEAKYRSVIVYIDDLDRCEPNRIIQCLEAVKLFVNVKRTAFIIGADERIIEHAIEERYRNKIEKTTISSPYSDYMEKLIQLPYKIPRLSFSEQETYITLLLCSKMENKTKYKEVHEKFLEFRKKDKHTKYDLNRIRHDNAGVDFGKIEKILPVIPIMTKFLNGNPRQLKRFLNTFDMRNRMAKIAGFENINPEILVKLMVLEYNSVLRDNIDDLYKRQKDCGFISDIEDVEKQAISSKLTSDNWTSLWNKPEALTWLASKPSLANVNLQDYFWISREALKIESPIENKVSNVVMSVYNDLKKIQTLNVLKKRLPEAIKDFNRNEKDMLIVLLHQELIANVNSDVVIRFMNADDKNIFFSLSSLKTLFEGIDTSKLSASYGRIFKKINDIPGCKNYFDEISKTNIVLTKSMK